MNIFEVEFLTLAEIIEIHKNQIELYGGDPGIRDLNLLSSALAVPKSTFNGELLHNDLFDIASAYIYHICQNHPFIDGNKRVALVSGLIFLDFNGIEINDPDDKLYKLLIKVASGKSNKNEISKTLKHLSK